MKSRKTIELDIVSPELTGLIYSVHQQFDRLHNLCKFLEKALSKETNRRRAEGKRQLKNTKNEDEKVFISAAIDDNLFEIERDFPRIVRYSLFVSMMSTTEASLVRLCRIARSRLGITRELKEKTPGIIEHSINYLRNEAGLDTSKMHYYKELADDLRNLRNTIAHSDGCIKGRKDEGAIRTFVNQGTGVEIDNRNNIVLSDRFVTNSAHGMRKLIIQLHGKLKNRIGAHIAKQG